MPDILIVIVIVFFTIVILAMASEVGPEPMILLFIPIILSCWLVWAMVNNSTPYVHGVFETKEVNGTAVIVVDGHPMNMTASLRRNVKDGTKVKVYTYQQWSGGIYHEFADTYKFEIVE